jgi:hypothetical protein
MNQTLTFTIDKEGKVTVDAEGFTGQACDIKSQLFMKRLGRVDFQQLKPEYNETAVQENITERY